MDIICPKGHHSTDADYCSECGAKIEGAPSGIATTTTSTTATAIIGAATSTATGGDEVCPDCGTKRANMSAVFCEVCRYNFATHTSWSAPAVVPSAAAAPPPEAITPTADVPVEATPAAPDTTATQPVAPAAAGMSAWDAVVVVDGSLYADPDPNTPLSTDPERVFPLDLAENLIGRRSDKRDIHPELNLNDAGISHRHAKLLREPDGSFAIVDVGSTNGTKLNDVLLVAGVRTPVKDGDQLTLGYWTRITIKSRA